MDDVLIVAAAGSVGLTFAMPSTDTNEFRGLLSDTGFTTFTISNADSANSSV